MRFGRSIGETDPDPSQRLKRGESDISFSSCSSFSDESVPGSPDSSQAESPPLNTARTVNKLNPLRHVAANPPDFDSLVSRLSRQSSLEGISNPVSHKDILSRRERFSIGLTLSAELGKPRSPGVGSLKLHEALYEYTRQRFSHPFPRSYMRDVLWLADAHQPPEQGGLGALQTFQEINRWLDILHQARGILGIESCDDCSLSALLIACLSHYPRGDDNAKKVQGALHLLLEQEVNDSSFDRSLRAIPLDQVEALLSEQWNETSYSVAGELIDALPIGRAVKAFVQEARKNRATAEERNTYRTYKAMHHDFSRLVFKQWRESARPVLVRVQEILEARERDCASLAPDLVAVMAQPYGLSVREMIQLQECFWELPASMQTEACWADLVRQTIFALSARYSRMASDIKTAERAKRPANLASMVTAAYDVSLDSEESFRNTVKDCVKPDAMVILLQRIEGCSSPLKDACLSLWRQHFAKVILDYLVADYLNNHAKSSGQRHAKALSLCGQSYDPPESQRDDLDTHEIRLLQTMHREGNAENYLEYCQKMFGRIKSGTATRWLNGQEKSWMKQDLAQCARNLAENPGGYKNHSMRALSLLLAEIMPAWRTKYPKDNLMGWLRDFLPQASGVRAGVIEEIEKRSDQYLKLYSPVFTSSKNTTPRI